MPAVAAPTFFCRKFPELPLSRISSEGEAGLIALGEAMKATQPFFSGSLDTPKAGYTYLGQFIDHDLTLDLTPLDLARGTELSTCVNFRTPRLDLEHLYGGGPQGWPFLYQLDGLRSAARFRIGQTAANTVDGQTFASSANDLPRTPDGIAIVGDARQDENLILAQLHVAFLKLHNAIIADAKQLGASPHYENAGSTFEAARRILTWHYQWVVRHDYLAQILDEKEFAGLAESERERGHGRRQKFAIPVEFSLGAFRFGHSMVRDQYFFNDTHREADLLGDMLRLTGGGGGAAPALPADWVIDWERFFFVGGGSGLARHSSAIDTQLAAGLHHLQGEPGASPHLAVRTLQRGDRVGLPSGQAVAAALGVPRLTTDQITAGDHGAILQRFGYDKQTPLWYYILKEAEVLGNREKLGPAGSRIVAGIIIDALLADPGSYLSIAPDWVPTLPGPGNPELYDMSDLLRVAIAAR